MDLYNSWLISFLLVNMWLCCGAQLVMPARMSGVRGKGMNFTVTVPPNTNVQTVTWTVTFNTGNTVPICTANTLNEKVTDTYKGRVNYYRSSYTLEIISLLPTDSGVYTLTIVDDNLDQLMGQTTLVVLEPVADVSVTSNLNEAVEINSTVILTCVAKGSSLSYIWLNTSTPLVVDGNHIVQNASQLIINNVYRGDLLGPIYCTAQNQLESSTSAAFNLTVNYGPDLVTITQDPTTASLKKGSNVTLSCSAKSKPAATFIWLFNQAQLPQTTDTLVLLNLAEEQSGNYSCMAYNSKTQRYVSSDVVKFSIIEALSGTSISAPAVTLIAGNSTVNLTCTSSTGKADSVHWHKNGKPLDSSNRIIFSMDKSTVTILTVKKEDTGEYKCQMNNKISSDTNNYTLTVNYGPDDVVIKGDKHAILGDSVMMNCSFTSYPVPTFVWKFNDSVLIGETTNCLTITNFEDKNSGIYTCEAFNSVTGLKRTATQNVTVKNTEDQQQDGLSNGAIAGIVIAVLVLLAIFIAVCVHKRRKISDVPSPY
ncbi:hypothetical protein Q7C36_003596 [Tachysurus vachellii]|uniref:Ig-like domain-containing protein n=1 Tax=Tachysurus vachellii TaxID=175792 RepID=A0AA88NVB3_TACVA|nr:carcinoembryonic antigen-related cell adhesion molecule 1 [Tachysurus vachellii]XP_060721970.1 carcinoembryonic antigen-related cell adhesion molecule 1 [Tachysurus vachellii]XP_060721971.1 carcinoembryonic antigen-related cell adhesion molecule 1 [Tachysurus vachellii]KAK2864442.1 hypothetical protein Q7C36_003596 [Tachysurus vachellii]